MTVRKNLVMINIQSLPLTNMRYISSWVVSLPLTNMRYISSWVVNFPQIVGSFYNLYLHNYTKKGYLYDNLRILYYKR